MLIADCLLWVEGQFQSK